MKLCKRLFALILLLCFLASLMLPTVSAATGTVSKNTATRHITCTSLSSQAQAYYTAGTYDYATISGKNGVYSTDSWTVTQNNPIYTDLQTLMKDTHTNTNVVYSGYANNSLYGYWNYTDTVNSSDEYLLFYCDKLMADVQNTEGYSRNGMEREHVWCKSKGDYEEASNSAGADLHHMRPSFGYINGVKSNRSFGNVEDGRSCTLDGVTVFTYGSNSESGVMEVNDNIKGDIARILLYVYVRWGQPNLYSSYSSNEIKNKLKTAGINTSGTITGSDDGTRIIDNLDTLLEWMAIDPVDTWEMQRNDQIENVQGNRNVFIDYPEYAWLMFGLADQMPTDMPTPSGMASQGAASSYEITNVTVNNSNYGSAVITNSRTVTVTPNENYYLQSATSTSGTVAINGNVITVSGMTANATVNVVFARQPQYTVTYSVVGNTSYLPSVTCNQGATLTLPTVASTVSGYTFLGWTTQTVDPESTTMPTVLTGSYTPTANTTLYAVYSREYENQNPRPAGYSLSNEAPEAGESVILARFVRDNYYAITTAATPGNTKLTLANGVVSNTANVIWDVAAASSGVYLKPTGNNTYLHMNSTKLDVAAGTDNADIVFTSNNDGSYKATRADNQRWITTSGLYGMTCSQNSGNAAPLYVFKYHDGEASTTTYYTTNPTCAHADTILSGATPATCTENGFTGNTVCTDCGMIMEYGTVLPATGHNEVTDAAVAATCTTAGKTEGSHCSVCNEILVAQNTIPALGHAYTSAITQQPTCTEAGVRTYTCSRCSNQYTQSIAAIGHSYGSATNTNNATYHTYYCQNSGCDYSYTESHHFTSTVSGAIRTYTCSDCGYQYTSALDIYVITYNDRGVTSTVNVTEENSVTLPSSVSTIPGYTFAGWSEAPISGEATTSTLLSGSITPTRSMTLYAVYARTEAGTGENTYTLVTKASQLQAGKNIIIAAKDYDYAMGKVLNNYYRDQVSITKSGNTLIPNSGVYTFTLGNSTNGTWSLWDNQSNAYLTAYVSGNYYDLGTETTLSSNGRFTLDISSDGTAAISSNGGYCNVRYVVGSYTDFACKNDATEGFDCAIYIEAPASSGTTYYTTAPIEPETYTVRYSVLGSVSSTASVIEGNSITLPSTAPTVDGYTFAGWSAGAIDPAAPTATLLTGSYTPTASVTLYAVYSHTQQGGTGAAALTKMNADDTLSVGDKLVVIANGTDYIMYQETQNSSYVKFQTGGTSLTAATVAADDKYYFDVAAGSASGTWKLGDAANGYLFNSGSNNLACDTGSASDVTLIDNGDGTFAMKLNSRYLSCRTELTSSNANLWRLGGTGSTGTGTKKLDLYKFTSGGASTTYYTTNPTGIAQCTHDSTSLTGVVAPTCTGSGFTGNTVCDDCGATVLSGTVIPATGHTPVTDAAVAPTCTESGLTEGTHCSVCSTVITAQTPVAALGHDYISTITNAATCVSDGLTTFTCSRCSDTYTSPIPATGLHTYGEDHVCTVCGEAEPGFADYSGNYYIAAKRSSGKYWWMTNDMSTGTRYTAVDSGLSQLPAEIATNVVDANVWTLTRQQDGTYLLSSNGQYSNYTSGNTATLGETGKALTVEKIGNTYTLTFVVSETETRYLSLNGTTNNNYFAYYKPTQKYNLFLIPVTGTFISHAAVLHEAVAATCTEGGNVQYYTCSGCTEEGNIHYGRFYSDAELKNEIADYSTPMLDHTSSAAIQENEHSATCSVAGSYDSVVYCSVCHAELSRETVATEKLPHTEETIPAVAATCTEAGLTEGTKCSVCGEIIAAPQITPALGHDLRYTNNGDDHIVNCSRCDYSVAEAHIFTDGTCVCGCSEPQLAIISATPSLNGKIDMSFNAQVPTGYTGARMVINGTEILSSGTNEDGSLRFVYTGINPQCMGDNISATLYATKNGNEESVSITNYSVREYCINKLNDSTIDVKLRALLSDLLAYGAAAQTYMNYKTDALVTDDIDSNKLTYSTFSSLSGLGVSFDGTAVDSYRWISAGLTLTNSVAMNFRFYAESIDGLTVNISINGRTQSFTQFTEIGNEIYEISFTGINATEFGSDVTASFWCSGEQVSDTVSYSVNSYVCAKQADTDINLQALVKALYNYGAAAQAYAN